MPLIVFLRTLTLPASRFSKPPLSVCTPTREIVHIWLINTTHHRSSSPHHHLPHLLPPSLSVHLLPLRLFYAQNKSERAHARTHTRLAEKTAETIGNSWGGGHHGILDFCTYRQHARRTVRYRWTICERVSLSLPSLAQSFAGGFNVADRDFRRSVFHFKVCRKLRNPRSSCHRAGLWFQSHPFLNCQVFLPQRYLVRFKVGIIWRDVVLKGGEKKERKVIVTLISDKLSIWAEKPNSSRVTRVTEIQYCALLLWWFWVIMSLHNSFNV